MKIPDMSSMILTSTLKRKKNGNFFKRPCFISAEVASLIFCSVRRYRCYILFKRLCFISAQIMCLQFFKVRNHCSRWKTSLWLVISLNWTRKRTVSSSFKHLLLLGYGMVDDREPLHAFRVHVGVFIGEIETSRNMQRNFVKWLCELRFWLAGSPMYFSS